MGLKARTCLVSQRARIGRMAGDTSANRMCVAGQASSDTRANRCLDGRLLIAAFAIATAFAVTCAFSFRLAPMVAFGTQYVATDALIASQPTTWPDFRGSPSNNAVTVAKTPRKTADAGIIWAVKFEEGYVSPEIIVNDEVIVTSGRGTNGKISKLNKNTGKVIAEASMHNASTYSLIPPTYADGKLFVTLSDGSMEAFDAKTLKSLWYYENKAGGQGNCPVVYSDGRVYTGYWSGESLARSFVCVDAKTGKQVWERSNAGGYYWTGALVIGNYLLFGCDDGKSADETGTSYMRCVDKATGKDVSSVKVKGDQRSTVVYDSEQGRIYFTSKPGYLYSARIDASTGKLSDLLSLKIDAESTATPLVYGGRVYVGASSGSFSEGTLSVVDAASLKLLYRLGATSGIGGTVKSAPLVSTAYMDKTAGGDGKLYLYLTVNYPPGGITMVAVEPNSTEASQAKATALFTPPTALQQYCIASVICDNSGNLYYRNDSNYLMCVGPGGTDPASFKVPSSSTSKSNTSTSQSSNSNTGTNTSSSKSNSNTKTSASGTNSGVRSVYTSSTGNSTSNKSNTSTASGTSSTRSTTRSSTSSTSGANQAGSGSSSSSKSSSSSASAKKTDSQNEKKENSASSPSAVVITQDDSTRHTDAEAATEHLDATADPGAPAWLIPVIVAGVAATALIALFVARIVIARRRLSADADFDSEAEDDFGSDSFYGY